MSQARVKSAGDPADSTRRSRYSPRNPGERVAPYLFIAPFVVLFLLFMVAPLLLAGYQSLHAVERSGLGLSPSEEVFAGFRNYAIALGRPEFIASLVRVLVYGAVQVPVMLGLALLLALLFDSAVVRLKGFFQLAVFLPFVIPTVIAALLWAFLYQPGVSPIVQGLATLGLDVDFLAPDVVLWSIANVSIWAVTGVNMLIMYAALQAVPRELYEAARIDGAGEVRTAFQIKVPMIAPALLITLLFSIIGTLQLFNEPAVVRTVTANVSADYTPNMGVFQATAVAGNPNLGSAMAVILAVVAFGVSLLMMVLTRRWRQKVV